MGPGLAAVSAQSWDERHELSISVHVSVRVHICVRICVHERVGAACLHVWLCLFFVLTLHVCAFCPE